MRKRAFIAISGAAALAAAPVFSPASAHCPGNPPLVEFTTLSEGVVIQEACYQGFSTCLVDTFHSDRLEDTLAARYRSRQYAVFGYVDSVRNFESYDSVYYKGQLYYVDTFTTEQVDVSIHTFLKDSLPTRKLTFYDRWIRIGDPLSTTYAPLKDTPFVAFFDKYDSIRHLGLAPMDGCFFEPTVFAVHHGSIHSKGLPGERMPGVSVTLEDFFAAVGRDPLPAPPVPVVRRLATRKPQGSGKPMHRYEINGRRLDAGTRKRRSRVFTAP